MLNRDEWLEVNWEKLVDSSAFIDANDLDIICKIENGKFINPMIEVIYYKYRFDFKNEVMKDSYFDNSEEDDPPFGAVMKHVHVVDADAYSQYQITQEPLMQGTDSYHARTYNLIKPELLTKKIRDW